MGFFDFLRKSRKWGGHDLEQEDREAGGETKRIKAELTRTRHEHDMMLETLRFEHAQMELQMKIDDLRAYQEELYGDDEPEVEGSTPESMLMGVIASKLMGNQQTAPQTPVSPSKVLPPGEPTDDELRGLWQNLPPALKKQALDRMKK